MNEQQKDDFVLIAELLLLEGFDHAMLVCAAKDRGPRAACDARRARARRR